MDIKAALTKMARMIGVTRNDECDCNAVYDVMDEVVEALEQGIDLSDAMPEIDHHLALCTCCRDELEALKKVLAAGESV